MPFGDIYFATSGLRRQLQAKMSTSKLWKSRFFENLKSKLLSESWELFAYVITCHQLINLLI